MGTGLAGWLALAILLVIPEATASARSWGRALLQLPESYVYGDAGANATCLGYATQVNTSGPAYLSSAADAWHSSSLKINSATCQSSNFGEFYNWTALSFDFFGTQANANCPMTISLSRCCNYNSACTTPKAYSSAVINITDLTPLGTIPSQWQTLTVSIAALQNNAALNCDLMAWNLGRLHYDLQLSFCPSCSPGPQNLCNIRRIKVLQAMPNLAPRVVLQPPPVYVGPSSVFYLSGTVTDDGLPLGKPLTSRWNVTSAPPGAQPTDLQFSSPTSPSTYAAFSPTALPGAYQLTLTSTDTLLTTSNTVTVTLTTTTPFLDITAPKPFRPAQPLRYMPGAVLQMQAAVQASTLDGSRYNLTWSSSLAGVVITQTGPLTATAAIPLSAPVTAGGFNLTATLTAGTFSRTAYLPVVLSATPAVQVPANWTRGTRIPVSPATTSACSPGLHFTANWVVVNSTSWSTAFPAGRLQADDCVHIPLGVSVLYDVCNATLPLRCVVVQGALTFSATTSTCLRVGTLSIMPNATLTIPPPQASSQVSIVFDGGAGGLNTVEDPQQETLGLLAHDAQVIISGAPRCGVRLFATGMAAGATAFSAPGAASCWQAGDRLVLSDLQSGLNAAHWAFSYNVSNGQTEYVTVASVVSNTITLTAALRFSHRDSYVGLLSRSVRLQSALPTNSTIYNRAHLMVAGAGALQLQWAEVVDMGRHTTALMNNATMGGACSVISVGTNQVGRYPVHMHRTRQNSSTVQGCAVYPSSVASAASLLPRHGIVQHDTQAQLLGNLVVGARGSGLFLEEAGNSGLVKDNLVVGCGGGVGGNDDGRFSASLGLDMGFAGVGIWSRTVIPRMENNTVQGVFTSSGFAFYTHPSYTENAIFVPIPGRDPALLGQSYKSLGTASVPFQRFGGFVDNWAHGTFPVGMDLDYSEAGQDIGQLVERFRVTFLSTSGRGLSVIHGARLTLSNCTFEAVPTAAVIASGVFKNNGVGSSVTTIGGSFTGWQTALGAFPKGTNATATKFVGNAVDIRFRYMCLNQGDSVGCPLYTAEGDGLAFVSGYAGQAATVRLFNSTASVPVGAAVVKSPVVTDGVAVLA